jgi:hypothetical protein
MSHHTSTPGAFAFGEHRPEYPVPVLNERAVRAAAGILFFFAIVAFMNAWLAGNFRPTRVFVVAFLIDFTLRLFVNPRWAPSLVLGQWFVRHQQPEYVGAPQKRFAWAIGFVLALAMCWLVVVNHMVGPVNLFVCAACLTLLFFEAAFGICIGCKLYNLLMPERAQLCPGDACEAGGARAAPVTPPQALVVVVFAAVIAALAPQVAGPGPASAQVAAPVPSAAAAAAEAERCKVPDFAKAIGHEQMWKLHNNCP